MLQAKGIKKAYGDLQVLKGVDISIQKGEILSVVGKSGTGKSTLLHILGTLDNPDHGQLFIDGIETNTLNQKRLAKLRNEKLGFIFQFHHLLSEFTALENICIPALIAKKSKTEAEAKAKKLLDYLGLNDRMTHKPNQLSGGEQQRVAVARALINDPLIVFADEPSGNLDNETSDELHNLIFKLREDFEQSFILVTHNDDLAKMSDRQVTMVDGLLA